MFEEKSINSVNRLNGFNCCSEIECSESNERKDVEKVVEMINPNEEIEIEMNEEVEVELDKKWNEVKRRDIKKSQKEVDEVENLSPFGGKLKSKYEENMNDIGVKVEYALNNGISERSEKLKLKIEPRVKDIVKRKRKESHQDVLSSKKRVSSMLEPTCRPTNSVLIKLFEQIYQSGRPNFRGCRVPLPSNRLNIPLWRSLLDDYPDNIICDFLEYGFPLDFNKSVKLCTNERRNH